MQPVEVERLYADALQQTRCVGKHHPRIKQVFALRNNTKPNPHKFCVIEGIWAHEKALQAHVTIETFIFCPEIIHSQQARELAIACSEKANISYRVSEKVFSLKMVYSQLL